jgi:hypothetical protein
MSTPSSGRSPHQALNHVGRAKRLPLALRALEVALFLPGNNLTLMCDRQPVLPYGLVPFQLVPTKRCRACRRVSPDATRPPTASRSPYQVGAPLEAPLAKRTSFRSRGLREASGRIGPWIPPPGMPLNFTYRRSSTFRRRGAGARDGQAMGVWFLSMALGNLTAVESWEWLAGLGPLVRPQHGAGRPGRGRPGPAPARAGAEADARRARSGPAHLPRGPRRRPPGRNHDPLLADTVGAARPVRTLVTPCPSVSPRTAAAWANFLRRPSVSRSLPMVVSLRPLGKRASNCESSHA